MAVGWFAIWRQLLESELWLQEPFSRGQAWVDLIGLARFEAGSVRIKGKRIDLERGQLAWSEVGLAERWKWSRGKVRRFLNELKNDHQIVQQKNNVTSVISITNYERYQTPGTADGTASRTADDTADGTRKNKGNKENNPPPNPLPDVQPVAADPWRGVEEDLLRLGVSAAGQAVNGARERGLSVEAARELLAEFQAQPGAWQPGALYRRITGGLTAWPPPIENHLAARRRADEVDRFERQRADGSAAMQTAAIERREQAEREEKYGQRLDGMGENERRQLKEEAVPDEAVRRHMPAKMMRTELLRVLDERNGRAAI